MKHWWATAGLVALGVLGAPSTASAHTSTINGSCTAGRTTLSVQFTNYVGESNSLVVSRDGAALAITSFGPDFRLRRDFDGAVDHTFTVAVLAADDPSGTHGWSFVRKIDVPRCAATPPPRPVQRTTPVQPAPTTAATTAGPSLASSPSTAVARSIEVESVLAGREVQPLASTGARPWWAALALLLLVGAGVTTVIVAHRRKGRAPRSGAV